MVQGCRRNLRVQSPDGASSMMSTVLRRKLPIPVRSPFKISAIIKINRKQKAIKGGRQLLCKKHTAAYIRLTQSNYSFRLRHFWADSETNHSTRTRNKSHSSHQINMCGKRIYSQNTQSRQKASKEVRNRLTKMSVRAKQTEKLHTYVYRHVFLLIYSHATTLLKL